MKRIISFMEIPGKVNGRGEDGKFRFDGVQIGKIVRFKDFEICFGNQSEMMDSAVIVIVCAPFLPRGKEWGVIEDAGCPKPRAGLVRHSPGGKPVDFAELEFFIVSDKNLWGHFCENTHSLCSILYRASSDCSYSRLKDADASFSCWPAGSSLGGSFFTLA